MTLAEIEAQDQEPISKCGARTSTSTKFLVTKGITPPLVTPLTGDGAMVDQAFEKTMEKMSEQESTVPIERGNLIQEMRDSRQESS